MIMDYLEAYRGKTILITDGARAIGSNLTRALGDLGASCPDAGRPVLRLPKEPAGHG
jgi:short-subunit dehydrogenase involved in D-alanine esterification of teichoic acids